MKKIIKMLTMAAMSAAATGGAATASDTAAYDGVVAGDAAARGMAADSDTAAAGRDTAAADCGTAAADGGAATAGGGTAAAGGGAAVADGAIERARRGFDFLHGDWTVLNRRQTDYANLDSPWETFSATNLVHALPAGIGNYDEYRPLGDWRPGFVAMTLRVFDPATGRWSIYWLTNRDGGLDPKTGLLLAPIVGRFGEDGVGRFEGEEVYKGRTARVRFLWTRQDERHARWEQAYSWDDGTSWHTNWIMEFTRK